VNLAANRGRGRLTAIILIALLLAIGYTAYAGNRVYQSLDTGRQELVAAQASMNTAGRSGDAAQLQDAAARLKRAEHDFADAEHRARADLSLRLLGSVPLTGRQIDGSAHLAAIGADLSRAGEGAAAVAVQVAALKQQYAGRRLTADDLESLLQQAQTISRTYSGSIQAIGQQLKAARTERAQVTTTGLLPPLQQAYDEVDRALMAADTAFVRYQDVRQVLSDFLGVRLPT
jgi:cell division protein FtsB